MTQSNVDTQQTGPIRILQARKSPAAIVEEVLEQAEARGIVHSIARLLVGTTLEVCIGGQRGREIAAQHKWKNVDDDPHALCDYRIGKVAILATMVRPPAEWHRMKANSITAGGTDQCWLLVRSEKIRAWQHYLSKAHSNYPTLIRCYGICEFIAQSVMNAQWRATEEVDPLRDVIAKLNETVARLDSEFLPEASVDLAL